MRSAGARPPWTRPGLSLSLLPPCPSLRGPVRGCGNPLLRCLPCKGRCRAPRGGGVKDRLLPVRKTVPTQCDPPCRICPSRACFATARQGRGCGARKLPWSATGSGSLRAPHLLFVLPKRRRSAPGPEEKGAERDEPVYRDQAGHRDRRIFSLVRSQSWNRWSPFFPREAASLGAALGAGRGWMFCARFPFARHCEALSGAVAIRSFSGDRKGRNYARTYGPPYPRGYPRGGPQLHLAAFAFPGPASRRPAKGAAAERRNRLPLPLAAAASPPPFGRFKWGGS